MVRVLPVLQFVCPTILNFRKSSLIILVPLSGRDFLYFSTSDKNLSFLKLGLRLSLLHGALSSLYFQVLLGPCFWISRTWPIFISFTELTILLNVNQTILKCLRICFMSVSPDRLWTTWRQVLSLINVISVILEVPITLC